MTITRRKFLKLSLSVGMISVLPAPLLPRQTLAAWPTSNLTRTDVADSEYLSANPYIRPVQNVGCGGTRGYEGVDPSMVYWDIHCNFNPLYNRDHRLTIAGTRPNAKGTPIIEVHGWLKARVGNGPNCDEDPADASFNLELDPKYLEQQGIDIGELIRVGNISIAREEWNKRIDEPTIDDQETIDQQEWSPSDDVYVAVAPPIVHVEMKSWHEGQKCDKCNCGPKPNPGWTVRPADLATCSNTLSDPECPPVPSVRELWWPWDPRYPSNAPQPYDPRLKLKAGDYLCVIGVLVTDDPHWKRSPLRIAWGDRWTKWGVNPKEHPYNPARWTEIHPPDHVHVLPPQEREETVRCVAMVARGDLTFAESRTLDLKIKPPGNCPHPLATVDYKEVIGGETTRDRIIKYEVVKNPDNIHVHVEIKGIRLLSGGDADFKAIYRVFWKCPRPLRTLQVRLDPPQPPPGRSPVTVYAVDAETQVSVPGAKVHVRDREVAEVGTPFEFDNTCKPKVIRPPCTTVCTGVGRDRECITECPDPITDGWNCPDIRVHAPGYVPKTVYETPAPQ